MQYIEEFESKMQKEQERCRVRTLSTFAIAWTNHKDNRRDEHIPHKTFEPRSAILQNTENSHTPANFSLGKIKKDRKCGLFNLCKWCATGDSNPGPAD